MEINSFEDFWNVQDAGDREQLRRCWNAAVTVATRTFETKDQNQTSLFSLLDAEGWELAEEGMEAATARAERSRPGWTEDAVNWVVRYMDAHRGLYFKIEDVKAWAYGQGFDEPPAPTAWGSVPRIAKSRGLIVKMSVGTKDDPVGHSAHVGVWRDARNDNLN